MLNPLGSGEQARIDYCGADHGTDLPHGFLNGIKKGATGVLHEMPAVGNLDGIRERFGCSQRVTAATVPGDHGNLWLATEPSLRRGRFAVRQQGDRFAYTRQSPNFIKIESEPKFGTERSSWTGSAADLPRTGADRGSDGIRGTVPASLKSPGARWPPAPCADVPGGIGIDVAFSCKGQVGSRIIRMHTAGD